jgi:hypothetical protein
MRLYQKSNQIKKNWGHDSSGRMLGYQVQSPEFKPPYNQEKMF